MLRRQQIIAGAEAAMGPMPTFENLPAFDMKLTDDIRIGKVRRLTMTIAVDGVDRLPLDLYLPGSMADTLNPNELLNAETPSKLAAIVALHLRWCRRKTDRCRGRREARSAIWS